MRFLEHWEGLRAVVSDIVRADVRDLLVLRASSDPGASRQDKKSDWHDLALFHKSVEGYKGILCRNSSHPILAAKF